MKQDWEIYRDTGILGAYRPEQVILRRSEDGGVETLFRDSTAKWEGDDLTRQRAMLVGGKCFLFICTFAHQFNLISALHTCPKHAQYAFGVCSSPTECKCNQ